MKDQIVYIAFLFASGWLKGKAAKHREDGKRSTDKAGIMEIMADVLASRALSIGDGPTGPADARGPDDPMTAH